MNKTIYPSALVLEHTQFDPKFKFVGQRRLVTSFGDTFHEAVTRPQPQDCLLLSSAVGKLRENNAPL
jgi:hypothetical protein